MTAPRQHFSVPANVAGRLVIWAIRRYVGPRYTVVVKSRGLKPFLARLHLFRTWVAGTRDGWPRRIAWYVEDTVRGTTSRYARPRRPRPGTPADWLARANARAGAEVYRYVARVWHDRPTVTEWLTERRALLLAMMRRPGSFLHDRTPHRLARRWGVYLNTKEAHR